MVLLIDNYDSFVHNLARYFRLLGQDTTVVRNDAVTVDELEAWEPEYVVISPGPCTPAQSGISVDVVRRLGGRVPVLGVCLGHQCIASAYGGRVVRAMEPVHGRATSVFHKGAGILAGLPNPFQAGRYHSLAVAGDGFPPVLAVDAWDERGQIMALKHRDLPIWGVQFHPESVLTSHGMDLLAGFLRARPVEQGHVSDGGPAVLTGSGEETG